ncbi:MAG: hypothetical protein PHF81_12285 [Flavobacterium sp.]|nr:hypothetical protein [Flavobacterium sp.]
METEFKDWEKIKSIVREYGLSINKPDVAKGFLEHYDQEHSQLSKVFGSWVELYTEIINKLMRVCPDIPLKDLLDDNGNYTTIEDLKYLQEENINLVLGENDSELVQKLKKIIDRSQEDKNTDK